MLILRSIILNMKMPHPHVEAGACVIGTWLLGTLSCRAGTFVAPRTVVQGALSVRSSCLAKGTRRQLDKLSLFKGSPHLKNTIVATIDRHVNIHLHIYVYLYICIVDGNIFICGYICRKC
jgi:hypothetical protein